MAELIELCRRRELSVSYMEFNHRPITFAPHGRLVGEGALLPREPCTGARRGADSLFTQDCAPARALQLAA